MGQISQNFSGGPSLVILGVLPRYDCRHIRFEGNKYLIHLKDFIRYNTLEIVQALDRYFL